MVVNIDGLQKAYGTAKGESSNRVLSGVDLTVNAGDFLVIMGRSGAGKTTLLNILGGLDTDYSGRVTILGNSLKRLSDTALSRLRNQHIGFVFQAFHLINTFSALQNVMLPAFFGGMKIPDARRRATGLLSEMGLGQKVDSPPSALSAGERQRVAIARAMLNDPELLLCDEPTGNLDPQTGKLVLDIFKSLSHQGKSVVMVTHDPGVTKWATRTVFLQDGRVTEGA